MMMIQFKPRLLLAAVVALAAGAAFAAYSLAQPPTAPVDPVDPSMPWYIPILAAGVVWLPIAGRVLAMVPFLAAYIPQINTALAVATKLIVMIGLDPNVALESASADGGGVLLAAFSWKMLIGLGWGLAEGAISSKIYDNQKAKARANTQVGLAVGLIGRILVPKAKQKV